MRKLYLFLILTFLLFSIAKSQHSVKDSSISISLISVHYAGHLPEGNMVSRFGVSSIVGGGFGIKTKKNWTLSAEYSFIFGNNVKNQDNYFHAIKNSNGYIIDANGMFAAVFLYERGYNLSLQIGKQFRFLNPNPNSGPFIQIGFGYLQHKVRIENQDKVAYQVVGDYAKGYDRLTSGLSLTEIVGYRFLSDNKLLNFYFGFEFNQAFTMCRRSYNIDDMKRDDTKRIDMLNGFRVGWIVPLYNRAPKEYYYF